MVTFLASILIWIMFFGLSILWVIDGKYKKEIVLHTLLSCLLAYFATELIKQMFPTLRPFYINNLDPLTLTVPSDGAFPSTHSAISFALAVTVFQHHKKVGILYLFLAGLVGVARIMAHVHYPIDIIGGAIIGITAAGLINKNHLFKVLGVKRK